MKEDNKRIMTLPTIALRGVSVYPGTTLTFDVARPMSIAALNAAMGTDRVIYLVAQRSAETETPSQSDLYELGTICRLIQILRVPGGNDVRAIVECRQRAKLLRITADTPCLWGNVQTVSETECDAAELPVVALVRRCNELFSAYAAASGSVPPELLLKASSRQEPGELADFVAHNIFLRPEEKQQLLEQLDPVERIRKLNELIDRELTIMELEQSIGDATNESVNRSQKEYYLREQLRVIQEELGEDEDGEIGEYRGRIRALDAGEEVENKLLKELDRLAKQPFGSAEGAVIRSYLDVCLELPWNERTEEMVDIKRARKMLDEDHFGLDRVKERIIEYLAVRQLSPEVRGGVLCLVGPPGVGKTSIAMSIARATNRKLARISLGGIHDEAEIRGHRKTYVGAMPGRIMTGISQAGSRNPLLVLDEIDKLASDYRGDPSAALLEALDGEQNHAFRDHFLELPFDLSETFFITTANTTDTIPRALLDRMEVIELGSYTDEEKLEIVKRHLLPKQRKKHGITGHQLRLSDDCIREIIALYARESGVRNLEREIATLCRKCAKGIAAIEFHSLRLHAGELEKWLGPAKYKPGSPFTADSVGLVHGLAWTSAGGELLDVECAAIPGSGRLELTGNLGDVMKESCRAALTYIRSRTAQLGIDPDFYKNTDLHLHFPEAAVPKDGPSAGAAICLAMVSALTGIPVRADAAMTGELTLRGRVLAIGGIREKTMAALRNGIHEVLLPEDNVSDLQELDEGVRNAVNFTAVSRMDRVLELCLRPAQESAPAVCAELHPTAESGKVSIRQ